MHTVGNLKDGVSGILSGINLSNVIGIDAAIERAARTMVQRADVPEASGRFPITLYSGVNDYLAPEDIFGGALLDLRPQGVDRFIGDVVYKKGVEEFDLTKHLLPNGTMVAFEYTNGTGILRVAKPGLVQQITLDTMGDDTGWAVGGSASGLAVDDAVYYHVPASLRFNIAAAGPQAYLEKTLGNALDLSAYEGIGVVFLAVRLPTAANFSSIGVRIGNNSANYFEVSNTEGFLGTWTDGEWLLVALDLALATETGSVDMTQVDYTRVFFNYTGAAQVNVRAGGLWVSMPAPHTLLYYSTALFVASGQQPSKTITDNNDTIVLGDAAYTLLEHEAALAVLLQTGGGRGSSLFKSISTTLHGDGREEIGLYQLYRSDNPSEEIRETGSWYD